MTTKTAQPGRAFLAGAVAAPSRRISELRAAWAQYREYLDTLAELQALTDRELADIGINRLMVKDVARDAIYGS